MILLLDLVWWFAIVLLVIVVGIIAIVKWTYRTGKKSVGRAKEWNNRRKQ